MPAKNSRFLLDNTLFIAAVKRGWTSSTELLLALLDGPSDIIGNDVLLFEYEKYAKILGAYDLLRYLKRRVILTNPSPVEIKTCSGYFNDPNGQAADVVHAATCLSTGAVLITNDKHFDRIKEAGVIEVWSITKAINRVLRDKDCEDL